MRATLKALLYLVALGACLAAVAALLITPWWSLSPLLLASKFILLAILLLVLLVVLPAVFAFPIVIRDSLHAAA